MEKESSPRAASSSKGIQASSDRNVGVSVMIFPTHSVGFQSHVESVETGFISPDFRL